MRNVVPRRAVARGKLGAAVALTVLALMAPASVLYAAAEQAPAPGGVLDGLVRDYGNAAASWLERVVPLAERTFAVLAALEFAVSGLWWALAPTAIDAAFAALLKKFVLLSLLYALIYLFPLWVPAIPRGFEVAGQTATGLRAVNPSQVLDLGITVASHMLLSFDAVGFLRNPTGNIVGAAVALLVIVAYAGIAAQLCLTLIETYVVLSGGCLFLGFAAFRATAGLAEGYILYAFQIGTKIYLLYLLLGVGTALSREWAALPFDGPSPSGVPPSLTLHFQVLAGALVLCLLVWKVPAGVAARLTQSASLRLGEALS